MPFDRDLLRNGERTVEADAARVDEITEEFRQAFDALRDVGLCVTIFGSARFDDEHRYYDLTRRTAAAFGSAGFAVMSGGGPGVMEAANRGASDVGARSIGCTIELPFEQAGNDYMDTEIAFKHFFARKVCLVRYSQAFILMPGGFGTLDEVFETATLIQTGKMPGFPLVLMGTEFWQPITEFVTQSMVKEQTIDEADRDFFYATDNPEDAVRLVESKLAG
jgi:uncharacterized protein (TIGR00730 family)